MKEDLPTNHKKMITQTNKSVDKVVLLVDDLLNVNKTYNEQLDLKKTKFNLYKVIFVVRLVYLKGIQSLLLT